MRSPVLAVLTLTILMGFLPHTLLVFVREIPAIQIFVVGPVGPIEGAFITFEHNSDLFQTDVLGRCDIANPLVNSKFAVACEGYFIAHDRLKKKGNTVRLKKTPSGDAANYEWVHPLEGEQNCASCHAQIAQEWAQSGHSSSSTGHRFLDMYSDIKKGGEVIKGWSLSRDLPEGKTVCASCHAPGVGAGQPGLEDISEVSGINKLGVHCDFCHKVEAVKKEGVGLSHGRDLFRLARPEKGQVFFGPIKDATRDDNSFSPVYQQSLYCASCHEGTLFGMHVYSTFSEWQKSPAAAKGLQCQACHMKPDGHFKNIAPGKGGIVREAKGLASHQMMPDGLQQMLQSSIQHEEEVVRGETECVVKVQLKAVNVGHKVPTGYIDRHMILQVRAKLMGEEFKPIDGPTLPAWVDKTLVGNAGVLFGRPLLSEDKQGIQPFWQGGTDFVDSRLEPEMAKVWVWSFPHKIESVKISLIYRPFWKEQQLIKQWVNQDIVVFEKTLVIK